ncbi:hypothetical protein [Rhizobium sp. LjRoot258]
MTGGSDRSTPICCEEPKSLLAKIFVRFGVSQANAASSQRTLQDASATA